MRSHPLYHQEKRLHQVGLILGCEPVGLKLRNWLVHTLIKSLLNATCMLNSFNSEQGKSYVSQNLQQARNTCSLSQLWNTLSPCYVSDFIACPPTPITSGLFTTITRLLLPLVQCTCSCLIFRVINFSDWKKTHPDQCYLKKLPKHQPLCFV